MMGVCRVAAGFIPAEDTAADGADRGVRGGGSCCCCCCGGSNMGEEWNGRRSMLKPEIWDIEFNVCNFVLTVLNDRITSLLVPFLCEYCHVECGHGNSAQEEQNGHNL